MQLNFVFSNLPSEGILILFCGEGETLSDFAQTIDAATNGQLTRAITAEQFKGKKHDQLILTAPAELSLKRIVLLGLGDRNEFDALGAQKLGGKIIVTLQSLDDSSATISTDGLNNCPSTSAELTANLVLGAQLRDYRFDKYHTKPREGKPGRLNALTVLCDDPQQIEDACAPLQSLADSVCQVRDWVSEPGNILHPESYADQLNEFTKDGVEVEILDEASMEALGMGALLSVGRGSARQSKLVVMRWQGDTADQPPIAFVGKGVTFDSGGISIKPAAGMQDLKYDMAGSATVAGLIQSLAKRKAAVNVVGVVGLVENMPSNNASRPGDIVTSMSGQTIEIINTDAEGRLVLADALWYTQATFKPRCIVDIATLTGGIVTSLAHEMAGIFSNNDTLAEQLIAAGTTAGEPVWRLPLTKIYDRLVDSDIADMKNHAGIPASSITAAQFLQRFVNEVPWIHIDIVGTVWRKEDGDLAEKGASGYGVRLLDQFVRDIYGQEVRK